MRRGFSIFLILIFGLGPLQSLIDGSEDASLPSCCRRHGAHHCAMTVQGAVSKATTQDKTPTVSAPSTCPYYPGALAMLSTQAKALVVTASAVTAQFTSACVPAAAHMALLASPVRTHAGRGPPASSVS
jgi:hypothetical protein